MSAVGGGRLAAGKTSKQREIGNKVGARLRRIRGRTDIRTVDDFARLIARADANGRHAVAPLPKKGISYYPLVKSAQDDGGRPSGHRLFGYRPLSPRQPALGSCG